MAEEGTRLFVGNLSWETTDQSLYNAFNDPAGCVIEAKVIMDKFNGKSRGFGFVTFDSVENASNAMERMNGIAVDGRNIRVDRASSQRR